MGLKWQSCDWKLRHAGLWCSTRAVLTVHWYRLPKEVVKNPTLEIAKLCGHGAGQPTLGVALLEQGAWTRWPPEVPSNLSRSMILQVLNPRDHNLPSWAICIFPPLQASFPTTYQFCKHYWWFYSPSWTVAGCSLSCHRKAGISMHL